MNDVSPSSPAHHAFWADDVADEIEARDPDEPIVIKGAVSPSGIPHIGHFNEIMRGYYVAEILRERGYDVRQIFTSDDRDALRKVPRQLADSDWNIVGLGDVDASVLGTNLGVPYADIPDPFGDHASYGAHFTDLLRQSVAMVGVDVEIISTTSLYTEGEFDGVIREIVSDRALARDILQKYQASVDADYFPIMAQCRSCKKLTTGIRAVDCEEETITYVCSGLEAGEQTIDGCGTEGVISFREGKLPWRFKWPAGWKALNVTFEPFGKDHAEGSWPSGKEIAERLLGIEPPVPMVYEWFTLNGEALSSSAGNVITIPELLEFIEPAVLRYFFIKNPNKQRDLDLSRIDQLVDEFDRFESVYFDEVSGSEDEVALAKRAYPFVVREEQEDRVRIPFRFAAVLGMTDNPDLRKTMAQRAGHLPQDAAEDVIKRALARVDKARRWAEKMDNEYNYRLQEEPPSISFPDEIKSALVSLARTIEAGASGAEIQSAIHDVAKENEIPVGEVFTAGYRLFLDQEDGPRLGPFLASLDREFVVNRLEGEE